MFQLHFSKNETPKFVYVNDAVKDVYEVEIKDILYQNSNAILERIHPDDQKIVTDSFLKAAEEKKLWRLEYRVILPKKGLRWLEGKAKPEVLNDGTIIWHGFITDITSHKEKELIIEAQKAKMMSSSKLASLGEMAGNIAHEINNPLAIISGRTNNIRRQVDKKELSSDRLLSDLNLIEETCHRIAQIVKGLKIFSRNANADPMIPCKVSEIVDDTLSLCVEKFKKQNVTLNVDCDPSLTIKCRATQISQVLMNLLNNAFEAIKDMENPWVTLKVEKKFDHAVLTIQDCGHGISSEIATRMMEPFFTTKAVGIGTGLGLSISSGIILDHSGVLKYDSSQKNTTFIIDIPLSS